MDPLDIKAKAETLLKYANRRKMLVLPERMGRSQRTFRRERVRRDRHHERRRVPYFRTARLGGGRTRPDALGGPKNCPRG